MNTATTKPAFVWDEANTETLRKLWLDGWAASYIAKQLGEGATRNAVIGKANRLALPGRAAGRRPPGSTPQARQRAPRPEKRERKVKMARLFVGGRRQWSETPGGPVPAKYDLPEPPTLGVSLMDLRPGQCRYIKGDDRLFCGQPVVDKTSWCAHHYGITHKFPR